MSSDCLSRLRHGVAATSSDARRDEDTRIILSPCPFCGAEPRGVLAGDATFPAYVRCPSAACGATGPESDNVLSAARLWNRRPVEHTGDLVAR